MECVDAIVTNGRLLGDSRLVDIVIVGDRIHSVVPTDRRRRDPKALEKGREIFAP